MGTAREPGFNPPGAAQFATPTKEHLVSRSCRDRKRRNMDRMRLRQTKRSRRRIARLLYEMLPHEVVQVENLAESIRARVPGVRVAVEFAL